MTDLLMDGALMQWPLELIKPYPKNAKKHPASQIQALARQIQEHGFDQPIVLDSEGVVVKGHGRLLAAKHLGMQKVPVIIRTDLTPEQVRAVRLADNKLAETDWDMELLIEEIANLAQVPGFDSELLGIDPAEMAAALEGLEALPEAVQGARPGVAFDEKLEKSLQNGVRYLQLCYPEERYQVLVTKLKAVGLAMGRDTHAELIEAIVLAYEPA